MYLSKQHGNEMYICKHDKFDRKWQNWRNYWWFSESDKRYEARQIKLNMRNKRRGRAH